jgi:hypothetical protein
MPAAPERFVATYLIETPLDPAKVADVLAGEQSSGTFVRVAGETDDLRARSRATVERLVELEPAAAPSLRSAWLERRGAQRPVAARADRGRVPGRQPRAQPADARRDAGRQPVRPRRGHRRAARARRAAAGVPRALRTAPPAAWRARAR